MYLNIKLILSMNKNYILLNFLATFLPIHNITEISHLNFKSSTIILFVEISALVIQLILHYCQVSIFISST